MLNPNRQTPSAAGSSIPGLEIIEKWLRGLSLAEIKELRDAMADHNVERLVPFQRRFKAWLERSG